MKITNNSSGMTLLEVLIALFIFTVVMLGANSFLTTSLQAKISMKNISTATSTGNQMLEKIRLTPYEKIIPDSLKFQKFICSWTVEANNTINMKSIFLTVKWPLERRNHAIRLSTIVSK